MPAKEISRARELRRNQTDAERKLWRRLRNRQVSGAKFRRQMPIGPYIVDFVCVDDKLIIEVDGGQHSASTDALRTAYFKACGYRVLRFWNTEVLNNIEGVLSALSPSPLAGEGGARKAGG